MCTQLLCHTETSFFRSIQEKKEEKRFRILGKSELDKAYVESTATRKLPILENHLKSLVYYYYKH